MNNAERAQALVAASFCWDNHQCMPLRPGDHSFLPQLDRARMAGFDAVTLNVGFGEQSPEQHLRMVADFRRWVRGHADHYVLIEQADDLLAARRTGRMGILFDMEGANGIGEDVGLVSLYYDLGVRWMLIAYNRANRAGSGCLDSEDGGLTAFGREMVREMNGLGMTVCGSHCSRRTALDVLELSTQPVIFSHSNCAAVYDHPRNISDEMIRLCASQGGVIGINGIGAFLAPNGADLDDAIVAQIDHAVQLVGPDHVGLSLDYVYDLQEVIDYLRTAGHLFPDFSEDLPMVPPERLALIVERLFGLGYADSDIRQIIGGAWLRIAQLNWRT